MLSKSNLYVSAGHLNILDWLLIFGENGCLFGLFNDLGSPQAKFLVLLPMKLAICLFLVEK